MFLNGKDTKVINSLSEKMNIFSENNEFERAAVFRDRIQSLRQVRLKQFVSDFSEMMPILLQSKRKMVFFV